MPHDDEINGPREYSEDHRGKPEPRELDEPGKKGKSAKRPPIPKRAKKSGGSGRGSRVDRDIIRKKR